MFCYAIFTAERMLPHKCPLIRVLKGRIGFIVFDGIFFPSIPFEDQFFIEILDSDLILIVAGQRFILICFLVVHHDG